MNPQLEIACFNEQSALVAAAAGANRIELCANVHVGGTTPDLNIFKRLKKIISIPIYVMIRPRGGNFVYSMEEIEEMKHQIALFKAEKAAGFVFGILNQINRIDIRLNTTLVKLASPVPCSIHRAFDYTTDAATSLEDAVLCGFKTILTSGCTSNVVDGISQLAELVKLAGKRIVIMPGGGVRSSNINAIIQHTKADFYHSSAIISSSEIADKIEIKLLKSFLSS